MLSLFRTNQAYAGLLLFLYALVLWLPFYLAGEPVVADLGGNGVLGQWLYGLLKGQPLMGFVVAIVLVGVQGIQANTWATRHRLSSSVTQFPGLFLVLVAAIVASAHSFHTFQLANIFLLFSMLSLSRIYKKEEPAVALFNAGAWLGIASLFRPEYLLFLPACIAAISILRRPNLRSIFQLLTGLLLVYFFLIVTGYLANELPTFIQQQFGSFGLATLGEASSRDLAGLILLGIILLSVVLLFGRISFMLNIEGTKNMDVLGWFLLFSLVVVLFSGTISPINSQALVVPLGIMLGLGMINMGPRRAEALHIVMAASTLLMLLFL